MQVLKGGAMAGSEISCFGDNDLSLPQFRPSGNDSKNCSERSETTKNYHYVFGLVFGYLTRSTVILKSNSFISCFNQVAFYDFQNFCQGKVVVKIFLAAQSLTLN